MKKPSDIEIEEMAEKLIRCIPGGSPKTIKNSIINGFNFLIKGTSDEKVISIEDLYKRLQTNDKPKVSLELFKIKTEGFERNFIDELENIYGIEFSVNQYREFLINLSNK